MGKLPAEVRGLTLVDLRDLWAPTVAEDTGVSLRTEDDLAKAAARLGVTYERL